MKRIGRPPTHGKTNTRTFKIWCGMKTRCFNPNDPGYLHYGARGITICDRWISFVNFLEDMGECPKGFSIERIDNDGHYCPENCKWIPRKMQGKNRRNSIIITLNGDTDCVSVIARKYGQNPIRALSRIKRGWSVEDAIFLGLLKGGPHGSESRKERQRG